jgi:transaldolase
VLSRFAVSGINVNSLSAQLQEEGAKSFVKSWDELMSQISSKAVLQAAAG